MQKLSAEAAAQHSGGIIWLLRVLTSCICNCLYLCLLSSQACTRAPAAEVQKHRRPGTILTSEEAHEQPVAPASTWPIQVLYPQNPSAYLTPVYSAFISLLCACPVFATGACRVLCMCVTTAQDGGSNKENADTTDRTAEVVTAEWFSKPCKAWCISCNVHVQLVSQVC